MSAICEESAAVSTPTLYDLSCNLNRRLSSISFRRASTACSCVAARVMGALAQQYSNDGFSK